MSEAKPDGAEHHYRSHWVSQVYASFCHQMMYNECIRNWETSICAPPSTSMTSLSLRLNA
jgi:hypothetical protein